MRRVGAINTLKISPDAPPTGDISIAFGLAADAAFQDVNAATYRGLLLLGMSVLLAGLAAMYGGRRFIGRPVGELLAAAKRWRAGDYKARVALAERSSELGHLATAYEEMADALAAREEERTRAEADLRASEERLRLSQDAGGIGLWDWNVATQEIVWSDSLRRLWRIPPDVEPSFRLFLDHVHPGDRKRAEHHTRGVLCGDHPFDIELRTLERQGGVRWIAARGELISDPQTGRPVRMIGTCQDITERKRAEEQQRLLINELNHRVKNTLATVQAIAFQSLKSPQGERPNERFEQRLLALSKTHDVLTRDNWTSTSLQAVVSETIAPYCGADVGPERFSVSGQEVRLSPSVVVPLSMALHELCTNAAKYGALSQPSGHVDISWQVAEKAGEQRLVIDWTESGGPPVSEPRVRGFGTRLIERSLARQLAGDVQLRFDCNGVRCRVDIPLDGAGVAVSTEPMEARA
jgi:two-component sensor histidine kinase/PAS domain-containing protein